MENNNSNIIYTTNYVRNNINSGKKTKSAYYPENLQAQAQAQETATGQKYIMSRGLTSGSNTRVEKDIKPLTNEQVSKNTRVTRINVDSRHRNLESKNILNSQIYYLEPNPISIVPTDSTNSTSDILIFFPGHGFQVNDNIVIQGVQAKKVILENSITFIANSSYARINHKSHGLNFDTNNSMYMEINNFIGNINGDTEYNNIPINEINGLQKI